ncbi:MAG: hypothetical protein WDM78_20670 [Puia sp.]
MVYRNSVMLENNMAEGNITATGFPCGVLQLTAFDGALAPLAERVVFINNQKAYTKVQMKKEAVNLNKGHVMKFQLQFPTAW